MSRHVLSLYCDLVNTRTFIAMLDGLICHCQVLVDGPDPIAEVHLVLGAASVALSGGNKRLYQTQIQWKEKKK